MTDLSTESRLVGAILGSAVGDAIGEPVEFMRLDQIQRMAGSEGVTGYPTNAYFPGAFSDDTQMTLWTAEGLIRAYQRRSDRGEWDPVSVVNGSYLRWLITQKMDASVTITDTEPVFSGWLIQEKGLWVRMAPGNTCLSALQMGGGGTPTHPINNSKGCGGVMRAAPAGLVGLGDGEAYRLGRDLAALTHGHPAGYIAAGALALIVNRLCSGASLVSAVESAIAAIEADESGGRICADGLRQALHLAASESLSPQSVERLGAGWVAEEALAIGVFCALAAEDFKSGVLAAVNHSGDSDSTGSICGQIIGTMHGLASIPEEWVEGLNLRDVVERIATDLHRSFHQEHTFPVEMYPPW